jgi:hypothetical protein
MREDDFVNIDNSFNEDDTPELIQMDKERKIELRLELDFENRDNEIQ